jgi:hypothetical protein
MQTQNTMKNTTSTSTSTTTTTTTTTAANTNLQTAFAKELATHGIVRVEFGTASAYWGHMDVTTLDEARAAAREFFADEERGAILIQPGGTTRRQWASGSTLRPLRSWMPHPPLLIGGLPIAGANVSVG